MRKSEFSVVIRSGKGDQSIYALQQERTTVGKGGDVDIALSGWNVSKMHAAFLFDEDNLFIEDLDSMFGTWVNGERSQRFGPLRVETEIVIGAYRISVDIVKADLSAMNAEPHAAPPVSHTAVKLPAPEERETIALRQMTSARTEPTLPRPGALHMHEPVAVVAPVKKERPAERSVQPQEP
ncbi:MAG: FHA domain-containing protein, partial [Pseudomonadota bacterium]